MQQGSIRDRLHVERTLVTRGADRHSARAPGSWSQSRASAEASCARRRSPCARGSHPTGPVAHHIISNHITKNNKSPTQHHQGHRNQITSHKILAHTAPSQILSSNQINCTKQHHLCQPAQVVARENDRLHARVVQHLNLQMHFPYAQMHFPTTNGTRICLPGAHCIRNRFCQLATKSRTTIHSPSAYAHE